MQNTDTQVIKRVKSFAWRLSVATATFAAAWAAENVGLLELPETVTLVISLVLAEVTKALNSQAR